MPIGAFVGVGVFLVVVIACVTIALRLMLQERERVRTWTLANGVVIRNARHPAFEGLLVPAVEFTDIRGELIVAFSAFRRSRVRYKAGDIVRMLPVRSST